MLGLADGKIKDERNKWPRIVTQVGRFGAQKVLMVAEAAPQKGGVLGEQSLRVPIAPGASQAPRAGRLIPFTGSSGTSTLAKKAATLVLTALALGEISPQSLYSALVVVISEVVSRPCSKKGFIYYPHLSKTDLRPSDFPRPSVD